jgi:hypothetical protein
VDQQNNHAVAACLKTEHARLATPAPAPVRLNPNLPELYRRKVDDLATTPEDPAIAQPAREVIRGLIARISVRREADCRQVQHDVSASCLSGRSMACLSAFTTLWPMNS